VIRRFVGVAVAGAALLAAFGCGGSSSDSSVRSDDSRKDASVQPAQESTNGATKTVTYQGVAFDVPADWPVHDLAADPTACVRFDVHAVYLGHPGADMSCPSGIVGRTEAVLVEPSAGKTDSQAGSATPEQGQVSATSSGLQVQVAPDGAATGEVDVVIPSAGVSVTITHQDDDTAARQILQSLRVAGS
jgi:hypothetical protein